MDETRTSFGDATQTSFGASASPEMGAPEAQSALPDQIGKYKILSCLGKGGMGVVYEAEQQHPRRKVALKVILGGQHVDESQIKMFEREADALARLKHPNIASIYESGRTDEGQHFFAMELVRGETLDAVLERRGPAKGDAEIRFRLDLFREICDAVHYAHQRGVIHRDLKPANILVATPDAAASSQSSSTAPIKILDFGLARMIDQDLADPTVQTEMGTIKGTLPYMSPEQASGKSEAIDTRTDVYALGVVLYEMLTGERPYDLRQAALLEAIRVICEEAPRPTSSVTQPGVSIDRDLETILGKALEKDPERRYSSVGMFSEDVSRFISLEPILARPPSATYQVRMFAARNRGLVTAATLLLVALVLGLVGTSIGFARARVETRRAENVANFFRTMLKGASPYVAQGRDTELLLSIVDDASGKIEVELAEDPAVAATLHSAVGETYYSLGANDRAESALTASLNLLTERLGPNHRKVLNARRLLALNKSKQGKVAEAEAEFRAILEKLDRDNTDDVKNRLVLRRHLAALMLADRRYEEAVTELQAILPGMKKVLGPSDRDTLIGMQTLGLSYIALGRYQEGEELLVESRERYREQFGVKHPLYVSATFNLGGAYSSIRDFPRAIELFEGAAREAEEIYGANHPDTALMLSSVGNNFRNINQLDKAEEYLNRALEIQLQSRGPDHAETLSTQTKRARLLQAQRKYAEADQLMQANLEAFRRRFGVGHRQTIEQMHELAGFYVPFRMFDQAMPYAEEAVENSRLHLGPDDPLTALSLQVQANLFAEMERYADAARAYEESLALNQAVLGRQHPATLISLNSLGVLRMRQGRWEDARVLVEEALAGQQLRFGEDHADTISSFYNLAWITANGKRYEEAVENFGRAAEGFEQLYGAKHPNVVLARRSIAANLLKLERFAEAEQLSAEMLPVASELELGREVCALLHTRARAERGQGKFAEALESVLESVAEHNEYYGPDSWQSAFVAITHGSILADLGRTDEAQRKLLAGHEVLTQEEAVPASRLGVALEALAEFYQQHGEAVEAQRWKGLLAEHEAEHPS